MSPKEVVHKINSCFTESDEINHKNGLEKIKTNGDAYLAVFLLPNHTPDQTINASMQLKK